MFTKNILKNVYSVKFAYRSNMSQIYSLNKVS